MTRLSPASAPAGQQTQPRPRLDDGLRRAHLAVDHFGHAVLARHAQHLGRLALRVHVDQQHGAPVRRQRSPG